MTISGFLFGGLSLTFIAGAWYFLKEAVRAKEDLAMARLRGEDGREPTMRLRMAAALVVVLVFFGYGLFPTVEKSALDTFRDVSNTVIMTRVINFKLTHSAVQTAASGQERPFLTSAFYVFQRQKLVT